MGICLSHHIIHRDLYLNTCAPLSRTQQAKRVGRSTTMDDCWHLLSSSWPNVNTDKHGLTEIKRRMICKDLCRDSPSSTLHTSRISYFYRDDSQRHLQNRSSLPPNPLPSRSFEKFEPKCSPCSPCSCIKRRVPKNQDATLLNGLPSEQQTMSLRFVLPRQIQLCMGSTMMLQSSRVKGASPLSVEAMITTLSHYQEQSNSDLLEGLLIVNKLHYSFQMCRVVVVDTARLRATEKNRSQKVSRRTLKFPSPHNQFCERRIDIFKTYVVFALPYFRGV